MIHGLNDLERAFLDLALVAQDIEHLQGMITHDALFCEDQTVQHRLEPQRVHALLACIAMGQVHQYVCRELERTHAVRFQTDRPREARSASDAARQLQVEFARFSAISCPSRTYLEHGVGRRLGVGEYGAVLAWRPLGRDLHSQVHEPALDAEQVALLVLAERVESEEHVVHAEVDAVEVPALNGELQKADNALHGLCMRRFDADILLLILSYGDVCDGHVSEPEVGFVGLDAARNPASDKPMQRLHDAVRVERARRLEGTRQMVKDSREPLESFGVVCIVEPRAQLPYELAVACEGLDRLFSPQC